MQTVLETSMYGKAMGDEFCCKLNLFQYLHKIIVFHFFVWLFVVLFWFVVEGKMLIARDLLAPSVYLFILIAFHLQHIK